MSAPPLLRPAALRNSDEGRSATWLELFFDLVFVVAVGRLAATVIADPDPAALGRYALLFVPLWWAWMSFTWYASAFDNDDLAYRLAVMAGMLAVAALAVGLGDVGDGGSAGVAVPYGAMLLLLCALFLRSARDAPRARRFSLVYATGYAVAAVAWLAAEAAPTPARWWIWAAAMAGLLATPPLATRGSTTRLYDPEHVTERYGLFTIIVLGESIVAVTVGVDAIGLDPATGATATAGFVLACAVWWLYFGSVGSGSLSASGGTRLTGFVWGYGHLLVFAGIALAAVGVELAIEAAHERHAVGGVGRASLGAGLACFIGAAAAVHAVTVRRLDAVATGRVVAAAATVAVAAAAGAMPAAAGVAAIGLPLLAVVAAEGAAGRRAAAMRPAPAP